MMKEKRSMNGKLDTKYSEHSAKIPVVVLVLALVLVSVPLVWAISEIDAVGTKSADVSKYNTLIKTVEADVNTAKILLADGSAGLDLRENAVTLIVPEIVIVDERASDNAPATLDIEMKGIYWNPTRPLVDIDNKTYYVGDSIQGFKIIKIGKTAVHFKAKDGRIVVKDFYENLLQKK